MSLLCAGVVPSLNGSIMVLTHSHLHSTELQGHAIKNQDLLAAAGAVSLKGSAGMSALDEDMEAAAQVRHAYRLTGCSSEGICTFHTY